ncbi:fas-activated serine/threonine kinase isoform X3 [Mesoplodon densirostris]|uniref:fas-activated serine/threonine kinase isoform X3 n=1 Tax=Mesoplodon densirostris TaxID=48708 RepID=UPI0028DB68D4|nr:fas-activated serine/threonine kinase isoform X3 [Mesoplodon densirostris]
MHVELPCKYPYAEHTEGLRVLFQRMEEGREGRVGKWSRTVTEKGSPSPNAMLRVLLSAQASSARLSGLLLLPQVQPYCLGPGKWGDRPPGGAPHAVPVQGLQRLLEQARSPGELLRWLGQNPTKVRAHHYPVALRRLGQLLGSQPRPPPVEQATLQDLSQLIIRNCPSFDIHTIHVCLHLAVLLGFPSDGPLVCALEQEQRFRLPPKPPPPLQPVLRAGLRLEAALSCPRFQRHPQHHLIRSLAEARPEELTPHVMVLLAQHLARHRLREPQLLEAIAHFLVAQEAELNSKVVQKLVLPFGRLNYLPLEQQFMPCLERILAREAGVAPLATVNILMSLCQLRCLPFRALHFVFSPGFISHISGTPHALIVRRYLSLLDTAVELELPGYRGPRLPRRQQVPIFPQPLITDRARCKYSHKDIVAEGLRQLLGEEKYRQDLTVPPGYCTDFLLCVSSSGAVLPVRTQDPFLPYPPRSCPYTTRDPAQSRLLLLQGGTDAAGTLAFLPGWQSAAGLTGPAGAASGPDGLPAPAATLRGTGVTERPAPAQELPEAEAPGPGPPLGA